MCVCVCVCARARVATETQRNIEKALRYSVLLRFRYKRHEKILNSLCCVDSKTLF